jgi:uncharacterized protein involved in cysteine biosynthesis
VRDHVATAFTFAKNALKAERRSDAGIANVVGLGFAFVLVLASGLVDIFQALARLWRPHYTTGLPSTLAFVAVFAAMFVLCVLILALVPPRPPTGRSE